MTYNKIQKKKTEFVKVIKKKNLLKKTSNRQSRLYIDMITLQIRCNAMVFPFPRQRKAIQSKKSEH